MKAGVILKSKSVPRIEFHRESINVLLLSGILVTLIGALIGASDTFESLGILHRVFVPAVYRIDAGVKELTFFPSNGKHAALSRNEAGFKEILEVIRNNDQGVPKTIVQITNRKEYPAVFYWSRKGDQSVILLDLVEQADEQSEVYPVHFTSEVFRWVNQQRSRILASRGFFWIFFGILIDFAACFVAIRITKRDQLRASKRA